jgi:hypothetical protein
MNLLAQYNYKVNRPLVPTLVHDDTTRMVIIVCGLLICGLILYGFMRYFNEI